jgi:hypothetical protein
MSPGQTFTKVWRLVNSGTCNWTQNYSIALFSGEAMGAPSGVALPKAVAPGQSVDISVDLVAPNTPGTYQGNWKLRNAANTWFGIGPNGASPFWVRIVVEGGTTGTGTPTTTTAPGSTVTPTPTGTTSSGIQVTGNNALVPMDKLDLDTNQVNSGGEDLSYEEGQQGKLYIAPINSALIGVFGSSEPSVNQCLFSQMGASPIALTNLSQGQYLCYRTNQGLPGRIRLLTFSPSTLNLTLQILTWSAP